MTDDDLADGPPPPGAQILWGRVLVLLSALALAFWLGTTFGGDDGSGRQLQEQADEIARLEAQIDGLEAELDAIDAARPSGAERTAPSEVASADTSQRRRPDRTADAAQGDGGNDDDGGGDAGGGGGGRTYVVQSGDTLAAIAQEVYSDPTEWRAIARANELRPPFNLTVGEELRIPAAP